MASNPWLVLDGVALEEGRRTLSLEVLPGDTWAVMGEAASGKSRFFDVILGDSKPDRGSFKLTGRLVSAGPSSVGRRATPLSVARSYSGKEDSALVVQALTALGLWEVKEEAMSRLTPSQLIATELLPCFVSDSDVALIDGHLDILDPWILESAMELIQTRASNGASFLIATNHASIAERLGNLIVWRNSEARFAGAASELIKNSQPVELLIESDDPSTTETMVAPFAMEVRKAVGGLVVTAPDGQALAAKLLTQGYGSVKAVVIREISLAEAILALY